MCKILREDEIKVVLYFTLKYSKKSEKMVNCVLNIYQDKYNYLSLVSQDFRTFPQQR